MSIGDWPCLAAVMMIAVESRETLRLERADHLPDGRISEFDLSQHTWCGIARGVRVASLDSALDQLLSNANGLVIHTENHRHRGAGVAKVRFAINFVDDGIDLELVIAFNGVEAGGPVVTSRVGIGAIHASDGFEVRNRNVMSEFTSGA